MTIDLMTIDLMTIDLMTIDLIIVMAASIYVLIGDTYFRFVMLRLQGRTSYDQHNGISRLR
jgi:hypothetical protein